jgi:hypothetical protein
LTKCNLNAAAPDLASKKIIFALDTVLKTQKMHQKKQIYRARTSILKNLQDFLYL